MNYNVYRLKQTEALKLTLLYILLAAFTAYLFYDSAVAFFALLPGIVIFFRRKRDEGIIRRKKELSKEFRDMILSVSTALSAGYSIENAFYEAKKDIGALYGEDSLIGRELNGMLTGMTTGIAIEGMLSDFAVRSDIDEIRDFAEIFGIAKRNGGDLPKMIASTVGMMREKDETEREIEVLLAGKRFEQKIMGVVPLFIILYLRVSTGSFMQALYHNLTGIFVMSVCLVLYGASYLLAERIVAIEV
ncbi:MAG: type II secretion system F family protein [Lachnospiraceae bacterium]|nr:type II secretion system F family protein [Lachnospiraceae bacterium]